MRISDCVALAGAWIFAIAGGSGVGSSCRSVGCRHRLQLLPTAAAFTDGLHSVRRSLRFRQRRRRSVVPNDGVADRATRIVVRAVATADDRESDSENAASSSLACDASPSSDDSVSSALALQQQAERLRAEADAMRMDIERAKEEKLAKRTMKIDKWIHRLLIMDTAGPGTKEHGDDDDDDSSSSSSKTELLNSVDRVMEMLRDERFSQEQVQTMYRRLRDLRPNQSSRSRCSPLLELLVDAAGKLDCIDREDNPNKRWNGKVERDLRRRLFAADFGIDLDDLEEDKDVDW